MRSPDDPLPPGRSTRAYAVITISLIVLGVALIAYFKPQLPNLLPVPPAPPPLFVTSSQFVDPSTGWMAAGHLSSITAASLYRTRDGGRHWRPLIPDLSVSQIQFFDRRSGIVLAPGRLEVTTDGGDTWAARPTPNHDLEPINGLRQTISFITPDEGWSLTVGPDLGDITHAQSAWIDHTTDGGRTWQQIASVTPGSDRSSGLSLFGVKAGIIFGSRTVGWIKGSDRSPQFLYVTSDGGHHWRFAHWTYGHSLATNEWMAGLDGVVAATEVQVSIPRVHTAVYVSHDGGLDWTAAPTPEAAGPAFDPLGVLDAQHWWLATGSTMWRTADAGRTWSERSAALPGGLSFYSLTPVSEQVVWAVASRAYPPDKRGERLFRSSDGGATWKAVQAP